ncbi:hypothetical protein T05_16264 [Trichinella murrelli]|uniref:Uncharacterized protein n=1 Tax=Trichinella murrelli TaxID=144512 RepID=A0A0V0TDU1_9BILA|nr:hypothetical protein T05_16264 [Trichinella murrelli]
MNEIAAFFGNYLLLNMFFLQRYVDKYVITKHYYQLMPTPRRRLRLCPRANKNLHIPAGYATGNL